MTTAGQSGPTKVVAIVQARVGSTRLAGKVLLDICGAPLLLHVVERVRAARTIEEVVIATTTAEEDRAILDLAAEHEIPAYAGSVDDVLDRFYRAARRYGAEVVVRVTADDPFKDPDVIDRVVSRLQGDPALDYVSNTIRPTYPEGLDIEAFTFAALERAWREAKLPSEREHVTPYIWKHTDRFRSLNVENDEDLSSWRWTLDYEADLEFTRRVYAALYHGQVFRMSEVVDFLRANPEVAAINAGVPRNEGYARSLREEQGAEGGRQ
jgi:spore coat polysaccharide biosynthesis protein SpsF